jgi:hypothetical protein
MDEPLPDEFSLFGEDLNAIAAALADIHQPIA